MLKLAVDLRPLLEPLESGVTQYTKALAREFLKRSDEVELDFFYQARKRCERIHELFPTVRHLPFSNTCFHFRCLFGFPRLPGNYFKKKPDLIWIPDRRPFYCSNIPLVMTIHDKVPELYASTLSLKGRLWHFIFPLRRLLKLCSGIVVPTFSIGASIRTQMPKEVTYEGVFLASPKPPLLAKKLAKAPFFLMISPSDPRKRLHWLFKMAERFSKVNFVVLGLKPSDKRFARLKIHTAPNLYFFPEISEGEKSWYLHHARALLALSKYEGFDLPVLEAVTAKCPVIMSDIPVHNELYKKACMVKTLSDLEGAVYRALHSKIEIPQPRGIYTWEKTADRTLLFFLRVLFHENR
ncbi:MAG: glycosyltransferase [Candidatus Gracilibacteria bacterium]